MKKLMTIMLLLCCVMTAGAQTEKGKQKLAKAQAGDAEAQNWIGWYYYVGEEGFSKNYTEACKWTRKAAENGNASAQFTMYLWRSDFGVSDDEAVRWLRKAAENGHEDAQDDLGMNYHWGELGLPEDNDQAIKWCLKSANQGSNDAMFSLGLIYEDINKSEAIYWFKKCMDAYYAKYGEENETASEHLRRLGVYYHPSSKSSSTASSSSRSSSSGSSSSSSSRSSSSGSSSSGSSYSPEYGVRDVWVPCYGCNGTGFCSSCHGNGYCVSTWSDGSYNSTYKCVVCYGSGRCQTCYGMRGHNEKQSYQIR